MMLKKLIFVFCITGTSLVASAAEYDGADMRAGLGYTDNVYQDDLNKKSDTYSWLGFNIKYLVDSGSVSARSQIYFYNKEENNNNITYSVRYKSDKKFLNSDPVFAIGGYNYFKSDIGSTEESYNNYYLLFYLNNKFYEKPKLSLSFEPGLKFTSYPNLSGRNDFNPYARLSADWNLSPELLILPYFELALIYSNQSYYTRSNIDLGITAEYKFENDLLFSADVFLRRTTYPNRKVSDIITLPRRQGRATTQSVELSERTNLAQFTLELTKSVSNYEFGVNVSRSSLNSLSELEYYNENQINFFGRYFFD